MRRKTEQDYHKLAQKRGFEWAGKELPKNNKTKTHWRCSGGHYWEACYGSVQQGRGCPYCAGVVPKILEDYHEVGKPRDIKWMGKELPENTKTKTPWKCLVDGHEWEIAYNSIQQGRGCPYCANRVKKTIEDYYEIGKHQGIEWVGKELPPNTEVVTLWRCPERYEWKATYHSIQQGYGCPHCAGLAKKTIEDYREVGKDRDIEWIGKELLGGVNTKTRWKCSRDGYEWENSFSHIQQGQGCPCCAGLARKTVGDYHDIAKVIGHKWVGKILPQNTKTKTIWKCSRGHVRETTYNHIRRERGCPYCIDMINGAPVSKVQRKLSEMLAGKLNYPFNGYKIDIALLDEKIAVEYDCWYWHKDKLEHDARRDIELMIAGWKILHVKSREKLPTPNQLDSAIMKLRKGEKRINIVLDDWGG